MRAVRPFDHAASTLAAYALPRHPHQMNEFLGCFKEPETPSVFIAEDHLLQRGRFTK